MEWSSQLLVPRSRRVKTMVMLMEGWVRLGEWLGKSLV